MVLDTVFLDVFGPKYLTGSNNNNNNKNNKKNIWHLVSLVRAEPAAERREYKNAACQHTPGANFWLRRSHMCQWLTSFRLFHFASKIPDKSDVERPCLNSFVFTLSSKEATGFWNHQEQRKLFLEH